MTGQSKLQMIMAAEKISNRKMADVFGCSPNTAAAKFQRGIVKIDDVIRIVEACGASLTITTRDGVQIPLTVADIEEQTKTKE